jgi:CRISPR-associated endonuclease/helicase Cas3
MFPKNYDGANYSFNFMPEYKDILNGYKESYKEFCKKDCSYDFKFKDIDKLKYKSYMSILQSQLKRINNHHKLRTLYSYISGILNLADWLASARFSGIRTTITFDTQPSKKEFTKHLSFDKLRDFQDNLSINSQSVLVEIPTGEGKTEGSLLWAIKNLYNQHSKIIYTLPTQTTSNKLYERVQSFFDKTECGLVHSSAKIFLEKKYEEENGQVDDIFKSDFLLSKSFNKPVTVSTIDSLLKYFINIGRFNIATKNFLNSVIIIDEVHAYDMKLMGFLKRFFELCNEFDIKVCLMSASIPTKIKELLGVENYSLITQKELFEKKANEIIKVDSFLDNDLDLILDKFEAGKNILVIRNTVKNATQTFKELQNLGVDSEDIVLYHSTFKKRDRTRKEDLIFEKLKEDKPFILVATQIVEVSLDIDFDVMFTDNAPIDSLIQRFGRVNRKKSLVKKGDIYIYKVKNPLPYRDTILDLTYQTIQNGYFELSEYVKWLNIVYDKLFEDDITVKNDITRLFDNAYKKYDETLKQLDGIKKSTDNYDLRDIEMSKNDYLLYGDYINDKIGYEYTISLPYYFEKDYIHKIPDDRKDIYYPVLDLSYSFKEGIKEKLSSLFC